MSGEIEILGLDHVSVAVEDLEEGVRRWSALLGTEPAGREVVEGEKVCVAFYVVGGGRIELVAPSQEDSPIAGFLASRGGGIHHICLRVRDAAAAWEKLSREGVRLLGEGPHPGAEGGKIFFLHPAAMGGVLVELKEG